MYWNIENTEKLNMLMTKCDFWFIVALYVEVFNSISQ